MNCLQEVMLHVHPVELLLIVWIDVGFAQLLGTGKASVGQ